MHTSSMATWFRVTDEVKLAQLVKKMDNAEWRRRQDGKVAIAAEGDLTVYFDGEDYESSIEILQELMTPDSEFEVYVLDPTEMTTQVYRISKENVDLFDPKRVCFTRV